MSYEPREGVDYIVDLYAVSGVSADVQMEDLKQSLNDRTKEYHPDRLQGVAPEFREKGVRMAVLLNKARHILLDAERRAEYDEILGSWDGPLSSDGTPVITFDRALQMDMAEKTTEEIESAFGAQVKQIEAMTGYSAGRLTFLEDLVAEAGDSASDALRAEYEDALLQKDRTLAIQEAERSRLLGLPDIEKTRYVAALGYDQEIEERIDAARIVRKHELQMQALGGVSTRLALLAGEGNQTSGSVVPTDISLELPTYFEDQATKVQEIAKQRAALTEKRLANFQPSFPEAELQTEFKEKLVLGVAGKVWMGAQVDASELHAGIVDLPDEIRNLLEQGDIKAVIEKDYSVLTFDLLEQIDNQDLITIAIEKYMDKYGLFNEEY